MLRRETSLPLSSGDMPKSPDADMPNVLGVKTLDISLPEEDPSEAEETICLRSSSSNAVFTSACRSSSRSRWVLVPDMAAAERSGKYDERRTLGM